MQADKIDIKSLLPEQLEAWLVSVGEPRYRAKQLFSWLSRAETSFNGMTNLPLSLREKLGENCFLTPPKLLKTSRSFIDDTEKRLWELSDGSAVETVFMRYRHGAAVCISTQVGCRMGCAFCASTIGGLVRNLKPSEMLDEVIFTEREAGEDVSNIVLMGIGEPMDNFENVVTFLKLINHPDGRGIGMRHITLSTCGLTEMFDKLGELNLQLTLSVSLHAPDDETRSLLMPVNRASGVAELFNACDRYQKRTGRRISFEYTLIAGVNDSVRHARLLAKRSKALGTHINIITLNPVAEREFKPSSPEAQRVFCDTLKREGANATVRRSLGAQVDAACGQLRRKYGEPEGSERE